MIARLRGAANTRRALALAERAHRGQKRASGEDYVEHPKAVARLLKQTVHAEPTTICAALLHDTVEDTTLKLDAIRKEFGNTVADIVEGVSKIGRFEHDMPPRERNLEYIRKMFRAMGKDLRVIVIKLADRLHNMQTIEHLREEKQKRIARETLDVFCPLADLLGIRSWFHELSDRSFAVLYPMEYSLIQRKFAVNEREHGVHLRQWVESLHIFLKQNGFRSARVEFRRRHMHGVYRSVNGQWSFLEHLETFYRIYVITASQDDCYRILGRIHQFTPALSGHIHDYIAQPKTNNYQALHTTVMSGMGNPIKVVIQTKEMDALARLGIAQGFQLGGSAAERYWKKLPLWVERLISLEQDTGELHHFFRALQSEIFGERCRVHVVGKKEKLLDVPAHSSVLDVAFAAGEREGRTVTKAIVNGHETDVKRLVENGDVVELSLSKRGLMRTASDILITRSFHAQKLLVEALATLPKRKQEERGESLLRDTFDLLMDPFYPTSWKKSVRRNVLRKHEAFASVGRGEINPFLVIESSAGAADFFLLDPHLFSPSPRLVPQHRMRFVLFAPLEDLQNGTIIGRQARPEVVEVLSLNNPSVSDPVQFSKELISLSVADKRLLCTPFVFALRWTFDQACNPLTIITDLQHILDTSIDLMSFSNDSATMRFHTFDLSVARIAYEYLVSQHGIVSVVRTSP